MSLVGARATVAFCFIGDAADLAESAVHIGPKERECTQAAGLVRVGLYPPFFVSVFSRDTLVQGTNVSVCSHPYCHVHLIGWISYHRDSDSNSSS